MEIKSNWNLNDRSIKEFMRVMLPDCSDDVNIYVEKKADIYTVEVAAQDKKYSMTYRDISKGLDDQALSMAKICLLKLYGKKYSWGSLMGVRPTKIFRRFLNAGFSLEETRDVFENFYLVSKEKIDLMSTVIEKEERLLNDKYMNVYIGIPFCPTKCKYCSFASYEIAGGVGRYYSSFVESLLKEIKIISTYLKTYNKKISSIYVGGGTPSTLNENDLERILACVKENFDMYSVVEFCFEAGREDTLNEKKLEILKKFSVDRISLNPQTFNEKTLKNLNRNFNKENFNKLFAYAKTLGFIINMDMIIGLPDETTEDILNSINELYNYDIDNLTIHSLAYKRRSNLFKEKQDSKDINRKKIEEEIQKLCQQKNLEPYYLYRQKNIVEWGENVGYAKLGKESIFNMEMIEENQNTMALGAGGISKIVYRAEGENDYIERYVNPKDPALYIKELDKRCAEKIALFEKYK